KSHFTAWPHKPASASRISLAFHGLELIFAVEISWPEAIGTIRAYSVPYDPDLPEQPIAIPDVTFDSLGNITIPLSNGLKHVSTPVEFPDQFLLMMFRALGKVSLRPIKKADHPS